MFVLILAGVVAGRVAGLRGRMLLVIALAATAAAWPMAVFTLPIAGLVSTLAHVVVAAVVAWAIVDPIRRHWPQADAPPLSRGWFVVPLLVLGIGAAWEVGEWVFDALARSDLAVSAADTVIDLAADLAGAVAGVALRDRGRKRAPRNRGCDSGPGS